MVRWNTTDGAIDVREGGAWRQVLDSAEMTFGNLDTNGDVGDGANQVAEGDHTHTPNASVLSDFISIYTGVGGASWTNFDTTSGLVSTTGDKWIVTVVQRNAGSGVTGATRITARWRMKIDGTVVHTSGYVTVPFGSTVSRLSISNTPTAGTHTIALEGYRSSGGIPNGSITLNSHVVACSLT